MGGRQFPRKRPKYPRVRAAGSVTPLAKGPPAIEIADRINDKETPLQTGAPITFGDSVTVFALLVGVLLVLVVPPLAAKVPIFVLICFGFIWLIWRSHWTHACSLLTKMVITLVTTAVLCILAIPQFVAQLHAERVINNGEFGPRIRAALVLDSASKQLLNFHLRLENIGKDVAERVRVHTKVNQDASSGSLSTEGVGTVDRRIPPGGPISVYSPQFAFKPLSYNRVDLTLDYLAQINGVERIYGSDYLFLFPVNVLKPATVVDPQSWNEHQGQVHEANAAAQFGSPQGTAFLVLDEFAGNKANFVRVQDDNKQFSFDPLSRKVYFAMKTDSGKVAAYEKPLPMKHDSRHLVVLQWDDSKGGSLEVDPKPH